MTQLWNVLRYRATFHTGTSTPSLHPRRLRRRP